MSERTAALSKVFAGVPGVVWEIVGAPDAGLSVVFVSAFARSLLGYPTEQWLSAPSFWLDIVHEEDRERTQREVQALLDSGKSGVIQFRWVKADGSVLWVVTFAKRVDDGDGPRLRAFTFDISIYRRVVQRLGTQNAITSILAQSSDIDAAAVPILGAIGASLEWDMGAFWARDRHASVLRNVGIWTSRSLHESEFARSSRESTFGRAEGLPGRVWAEATACWIPDVTHDTNFSRADAAAREGLHAAFAFPIVLGGDVLGVVEFFSRRILEPELELLEMTSGIGAQIGQFIERKRAENAVHDSERTLLHILESALDAVIGMDANGIVTAWNSQASATFGWTEREALGQRVSELIIPEDRRADHDRGLRLAASTGEGAVIGRRIEIEGLHKDGRTFPVELAVTATRSPSAWIFTAFVRDISAIRQRDQRKDDFLAFASHELRSPLTTVNGMAKWLVKQPLPGLSDDERDAIETLSSESDRLVQMVDLFLDLTRIDSDRLTMDLDALDLGELVQEEAELLKTRYPDVTVETDVSLEPIITQSDAIRLRQVLVNLLDNAAKYGGVDGRISVSLASDDRTATITVADNGPGLDPEHLPHIFDRFYRAPGQHQKGLGIGLFVSSEIIEKLGGRISARNGSNGGAAFDVRLPLRA